MSSDLVKRLADIPSVISLKWAAPDTGMMEFEQIVSEHSGRFVIIDNQLRWVTSHILGARSIEAFETNYWPSWSIGIWDALEAGRYADVQREIVRVALPLHRLWAEIEHYTSGNGYPVKLCVPSNVTPERKRLLDVYGAEVFADYDDIIRANDGWQDLLEGSGADTAVVERSTRLASGLRDAAGWSLVLEGPQEDVFVRD